MATKTPEFRASYPNVFKAKKNDLNGKDEYSIVCLFKKGEDMTELQNLAKDTIEKKWGTDRSKWPTPLKSPFRLQQERAKAGVLPEGYEQDAIFINLKGSQRPGLVKLGADGKLEDILDTSDFYAGCYAKATVTCYAYDQKGNRGVAFGLANIFKTKDGVPLSGRSNAADDFADVRGELPTATPANPNDMFG